MKKKIIISFILIFYLFACTGIEEIIEVEKESVLIYSFIKTGERHPILGEPEYIFNFSIRDDSVDTLLLIGNAIIAESSSVNRVSLKFGETVTKKIYIKNGEKEVEFIILSSEEEKERVEVKISY